MLSVLAPPFLIVTAQPASVGAGNETPVPAATVLTRLKEVVNAVAVPNVAPAAVIPVVVDS